MDAQDYLNQIAAEPKVVKPKTGISKWLTNRFVLVGLIGVVGLVVIIVIGAIIGGGSEGVMTRSLRLLLHVDNTATVVTDFQPSVKSSELRSSSASLAGVLSNTSRELTSYLTEKYGEKVTKDINKNLEEDANLAKDALDSELFEAKINGLLDRIYAHKMAYEVSALMSEESEISSATNDASLKSLLTTSYDSLKNLYDRFNGFSETK